MFVHLEQNKWLRPHHPYGMYDTWMTAEHISKKYRKVSEESQSMVCGIGMGIGLRFKYLVSNMIQLILLSLQSSTSSFTFPARELLDRYRLKWSIQMELSSEQPKGKYGLLSSVAKTNMR